MSRPLRKVVDPGYPRQSNCIGNNALTTGWWELLLECGHRVERRLRFPKQVGVSRRGFSILHHPRPTNEALPAPKAVRCERCPEEKR